MKVGLYYIQAMESILEGRVKLSEIKYIVLYLSVLRVDQRPYSLAEKMILINLLNDKKLIEIPLTTRTELDHGGLEKGFIEEEYFQGTEIQKYYTMEDFKDLL